MAIYNYDSIRKRFKADDFAPLYLIHGKEEYLMQHLINDIKKKFLNENAQDFDLRQIDYDNKPSNLNLSSLSQEVQTPSFLSQKRIILIKNSNIITSQGKSLHDDFGQVINALNDGSILIFYETKVEKRYKKIMREFEENGHVVNVEKQSIPALKAWVSAFFSHQQIKIYNDAAENLIERCDRDMVLLRNEMQKIYLICANQGISEVNLDLIEDVSVPDISGGIFDLTDAISAGQVDSALQIYENMLEQKISPIYIMFMIARQFKNLYVAKMSRSKQELMQKLKTGSFLAGKLMAQRGNFDETTIQQSYLLTAEMDYKIKTGQVGENESVVLLILEIANL